MKVKCIIITNKNSWVSEPAIEKLNDSLDIELQSVVFFDAKGNLKLIKRRFKQYGIRKFIQKIYFIIKNAISSIISFNNKSNNPFKLSFQTVKDKEINYWITNNLNDIKTISYIADLKPDIVFVFSCSQILSKAFLSNQNIKFINFHDSLLPSYKGPSPSFWVLYNQEKVTGYTIHFISHKIDSGEIIYQEIIDIGTVKSEEELIQKIVKKATFNIEQIIINIRNNVKVEFEKIQLVESYEGIPNYNQRKKLYKVFRTINKR